MLRTVLLLVLVSRVVAADPFATPHGEPVAKEAKGIASPAPQSSAVIQAPALQLLPCTFVDRGRSRRHTALWIGAGATAIWTFTLGLSVYEVQRYDRAIARFEAGDPSGRIEANRATRTQRVYATTLFSLGAVALGAAAYLYFTAPSKEAASRTAVVPTASGDQLGLAAVGRF
ncbi:MAG: hypothetical protein JWO36_3088 [Myxococcales bacterium]|nr:hypothetical protein [Myxococcales bacterium]